MVITGSGRADFSISSAETYASSRYIYIVAAMLMPAIAVAASQVILKWSKAWVFVVAILVLGIPGNIALLHRNNHLHQLDLYRQFILSIPRLPVASRLPRSVLPDPYFDNSVTVGVALGRREVRTNTGTFTAAHPSSDHRLDFETGLATWSRGNFRHM